LGLTGVTATAVTISAISLTGTGQDRIFTDQLAGATIALSGAHTAVALGNITVNGRTFINTTAAQSMATAGNFDYNFNDGDGNTFTVSIATTGNATAGTATGNIAFDATYGGALENTGTTRPIVTSVVNSTTPGSEFNWGSLTNARVTFDATNETAVTAAITINGVAFSTANPGGATANFSTTGTKNLTLADANGNAFTIQSNVTRAFGATDSTGQIVLAEFGQYMASQSNTTANTALSFKVGTGVTSNDSITVTVNSATTSALGLTTSVVNTASNADTAIGLLNTAITTISSNRASVGAAQSRLDFASNSIAVAIENFTSATSSLVDVDVSAEITEFTSQNVLLQAGISLLAQANQQPSLLLRLLQ
jgi:flagellin-like hook-associated protein FlgL